MSTPRPAPGERGRDGTLLEIRPQPQDMSTEAFVERVRRRGAHVEVDVLLADGRDAMARFDAAEWDWLEVRTGDIVPVRCLQRAMLSA
jgi:hypothetical protein